MASRNSAYEQRKREQGLVKVTLWVPARIGPEFKLAADICCANEHLTLNTLRDLKTGRYVSLERAVTGDTSSKQ